MNPSAVLEQNALGTGQKLYQKARTLIPGGTQLLSKRPEMFLPEQWPAYYAKAKGAEVWDLDGNRYFDFATNGIGACVLGFADTDVDNAVRNAIDNGSMSTLNPPEEVELAELLVALHPWAEMARFARGGGEMMSVAVRIARAATGRDIVAFCGYHGWHDWYLAANLGSESVLDGHLLKGLEPAGVPRGLSGTMQPFHYNNIAELEQIVAQHGNRIAAIVMEPARNDGPAENFLHNVRAIATRIGAALIFDEVTSGWRVNTGGIHLTYDVEPDLAVFAKALGNGYPAAAVIGRRDIMQAAQRSFISSTSWTERVGPTAAVATVKKHRDRNVGAHLVAIGEQVQRGWTEAAAQTGLDIHVSGLAPLSHFDIAGADPAASMTLFIQEMLGRGFLASGAFYASYAHTPEMVEQYIASAAEVFDIVARAEEQGNVAGLLRGPVKHSGFQRLN